MSDMTSKEYALRCGMRCPNCGRKRGLAAVILGKSVFTVNAGKALRINECSYCKASWKETWDLVGYQEMVAALEERRSSEQQAAQ